MLKSDKKLSPAKKACIKFSVLSAVNGVLGICGFALSSNPLIGLVSGASLVVSGLWSFLAIKASRSKDKINEKKFQCKVHKDCYKKAKACKGGTKKAVKEQIKEEIPGKSPIAFAKRIVATQKAYKEADIPKSAKPLKACKGVSICTAIICGVLTLACGALLANNIIDADTLASESNTEAKQYIKTEAVTNNSIGLGIAGISCIGLGVAAASAAKAARKREDDMIENYHKSIKKEIEK